jgi:hypothetical protein
LWELDGDGTAGDFSGVSWEVQHGHQLLDNGNLLLFNNGTGGFDGLSFALEFTLDESEHVASEIWNYDGNQSSFILGDVQRIGNGNTLVDYSMEGVIHEVTGNNTLVRTIEGGPFGYLDWRESLYGPPNRW